MSDLDQDLREMFRRHETDVAGPVLPPPQIVKRVRQRQFRTVSVALIGVFVVIAAGVALSSLVERADQKIPIAPTPSPSQQVSVALDRPKLVLDYNYSSHCGFGEYPGLAFGRFDAAARIKNLGDVGIIADVTAHWDGGRTRSETKTVSVGPGQSKRVQFTIVATYDVLHQSPAYDYTRCDVDVTRVRFTPDPA
jgi:hypothetical protein